MLLLPPNGLIVDAGDSPNALQNLLSSITSEMTMHWGPEPTETVTASSSSSQSSAGNGRGAPSPGQNTQAPGNRFEHDLYCLLENSTLSMYLNKYLF